ncbi:MAG: BLUF domain-containing protein [Pseudomonadota bacterium]
MSRCRLIYRSNSIDEMLSETALETLAQVSAERNAARNITGMLLLSGDRFLQVLEGPVRAINQLYGNIINDPRHENVTLLTYEPLGPAYFAEWDMVMLDLYNLPLEPRRFLMSKYESNDGQLRIPDRLHEVYALLLDAKAICQLPDAVAVGLRPVSLAK